MSLLDPNSGQMVEVSGTMDGAGNFIVQDPSSIFGGSQQQSAGKSLLKPELAHHIAAQQSAVPKVMFRSAQSGGPGGGQQQSGGVNRTPFSGQGGNTSSSLEPRWLQQSTARGGKVLPRKPGGMSSGGQSMMSGGMGGRFPASSGGGNSLITGSMMSGNMGGGGERDSMRLAAAAPSSSRGRPRGRRPLRGQFPVVPIDMVRQLGIEQQVILQPPFPVAMRNKGVLSKALTMSRKTQCIPNHSDSSTQTQSSGEIVLPALPHVADGKEGATTGGVRPIYVPVPVPIPIYVPLPMKMYSQPTPVGIPLPVPFPIPLALLLEGPEEGERFARSMLAETAQAIEDSSRPISKEDTEGDIMDQMLVHDTTEVQALPTPIPVSTGIKRSQASITTATSSVTSAPTSIVDHTPVGPTEVKRARVGASGNTVAPIVSDTGFRLKFSYGINAWRHWVSLKKSESPEESRELCSELLDMSSNWLAQALAQFVHQVRKPNNECYVADSIFYLCLGIQEYLNENGREENLFGDPLFLPFASALDQVLANFEPRISPDGLLICRIDEEHLWEARQLGQQTPEVLLFTMVYFNTKHLSLNTPDAHQSLTMSHFSMSDHAITFQSSVDEAPLEIGENEADPAKCPVRLFATYAEKWIENNSSDMFYQSAASDRDQLDSWFDGSHLNLSDIDRMLNRVKLVKEIQEVFMHNQADLF